MIKRYNATSNELSKDEIERGGVNIPSIQNCGMDFNNDHIVQARADWVIRELEKAGAKKGDCVIVPSDQLIVTTCNAKGFICMVSFTRIVQGKKETFSFHTTN